MPTKGLIEVGNVRGTLRVIGDLHGRHADYLKIIADAPRSLQLGDFGFDYDCLQGVDPDRHKVVKGNHDNYSLESPHFLGDGGTWEELFFIRGERSIDAKYRTPGLDWWPQEELNHIEMDTIYDLYEKARPEFVVSHGCPSSIIPSVARYTHFDGEPLFPSNTALFLQALLEVHRPKLWIFGHYHITKVVDLDETKFVCLAECEYVDVGGLP